MSLILPGTPAYDKYLMDQVAREQKGLLYPYWRQAKVVTCSTSDATCTIEIGGDTSVDIGGVKFIRHAYRPQVGDWVWVMQNGSSFIIVGMVGEGQSPAPSAWTDQVSVLEGTTSTSYTDLATYGPEIANILLYKDEKVWVEIETLLDCPGGNGHAAVMSFTITGASSLSLFDTNAIQWQATAPGTSSRKTLYTIQNTGLHTFTAKYKAINPSSGNFNQRRINVEIAGT